MSEQRQCEYQHTQTAPLGLIILAVAALMFSTAWFVRTDGPPLAVILAATGILMVLLAAAFQHLTVADEGDRLAVRFGPLPLFRRRIAYDDMVAVEIGRTKLLDGWGIHRSMRGGWVWNLWGRDCVVVQLRRGTIHIGTDDPSNLARFLHVRLSGDP